MESYREFLDHEMRKLVERQEYLNQILGDVVLSPEKNMKALEEEAVKMAATERNIMEELEEINIKMAVLKKEYEKLEGT